MKLLNMLSLDACDPPVRLGAKRVHHCGNLLPIEPLKQVAPGVMLDPDTGRMHTERKDALTLAAEKAQRHAENYGGRDVGGKGGATQGRQHWGVGFGTRPNHIILDDVSEEDQLQAVATLTKLYTEWGTMNLESTKTGRIPARTP